MNKKAYELMLNSNNIAIFTHVNPDCDGVASSIALKLHLESLNKKVQLFCDDSIPDYLSFLPYTDTYINNCNKNYDLAIIVDCVSISRIGNCAKFFSAIKNSIVIDHHEHFSPYALINISNDKASSTGEMLYDFFIENKVNITKQIASCIYSAIASDTGGFIHSNTTQKTFNVISQLIEYIDYIDINEKLFKTKSMKQIKLLQIALKNTKYYFNNSVLICPLRIQDFVLCGACFSDTLGISNLLSSISNIKMAILISEKNKNEFLLSIRSKGNISANQVATIYGGGGHFNAAGCRIFGKLTHILPKLIDEIKKVLENECNN